MYRSVATLSALVGMCFLAGCAANQATFGEPVKEPPTVLKTEDVMKNAVKYEGKMVRVEGYVMAVCPGSGCWMELCQCEKPCKHEPLHVWFTFDKSAARVPVEAVGHKAIAEGKLVMAELSVDEQRHFAEEKGYSRDEINKITKPKKVPQIQCNFTQIEGVKVGQPQTCDGKPIES